MRYLTVIPTILVFVASVKCLPADSLITEEIRETELPNVIFLINIHAIKNGSAMDISGVLHSDVIEKTSSEIADEPNPTFMLVVAHEDERHAVNLSEVAVDLERDGFVAEEIAILNVTRLIRLNLTVSDAVPQTNEITPSDESPVEGYFDGQLLKVRRKRTLCMSCMTRRSGCGGGGGGGCRQRPQMMKTTYKVVPVYVTVITVPVKRPPKPNYCDPCARG